MADSVKLNILRYDPSVDESPYYETYEAEWQDDGETDFMSLLQALSIAYDSCDDPATFDMNCAAGWCGRCTMMVNGRPQLACWSKVDKGGSYTIEPLSGFPVIRDLIVDKSAVYQKYVDTNVAVQSKSKLTKLSNIDYELYWNVLQKFNVCRECMCCYAVCPKVQAGPANSFIGPGAMMQIAMRYMDPNDEADRAWQAAFSGLFECDLCGECSSVCPASIDIVGMISTLQNAAQEEGLTEDTGIIPTNTAATAEAIAEAKGVQQTEPSVTAGDSIEETVEASCSMAGCHDSSTVLEYRTDADSARLRVDSHVATRVSLTDEQREEFIDYFTE